MLLAVTLLACAVAPPPAPLSQRHVYVGAYLTDVSDFDLKAGRFKADLRVWVKWLGDETVPNVTFENAELDSKDEQGREHDGAWHSVQWRVQGTFRGDFPLYTFPFDHQTLPVVFGLNEREGKLVPDLGASGMSPGFSITGWAYEPYFTARTELKRFGSDLGSITQEGQSARLRLAAFAVEMHRPFGPYLIKFALPLALIVLMALLALFLPADRLDVRSAMGITALLSCIAFHYTQADTLPDVTYLVAADKLFLGAYVFVAGTLLLSVLSFRLHEHRPATARHVDRLGVWLFPALSVLGMVWLAVGVRRHEDPEPVTPPELARPSLPVLRISVASLDTPAGGGLPPRRASLVTRGADGVLRPSLAQEAPAMTNALVRLLPEGGMRVRWHLKEGTHWSDGTPLTADDLVFSLSTLVEPLRTGVERIDARTVDVTFSERRSQWLTGFGVFPKTAAPLVVDGGREVLGRATSEGRLAAGGPYTLTTFEQGKRLVLARNERFAGARPVFERVEVGVLDPMAGAQALLANEVDVLPVLTADSYELLKGKPGVRILEQPGDQLWVLMPNLRAPPWDSLELRRSLLAALDRKAMVTALEPAPTQVASGWKALAKPGRLDAGPGLQALAGQTVKLHVSPLNAKGATHALLAQRIVEDLGKVGLTVEVVEHAELNQLSQRGDFEGLLLVGRDTSDPSRLMNVPYEGGRYVLDQPDGAHFDAAMIDGYDRFVTSLYDERRAHLEESLQRAWLERLPLVPLVLTSRLAAVRAELQGPEWGEADSLWWNVIDWRRAP